MGNESLAAVVSKFMHIEMPSFLPQVMDAMDVSLFAIAFIAIAISFARKHLPQITKLKD